MRDEAARQLASWDMTPADAQVAGIFEVNSATQIFPEMEDRPALVIPYYAVDGQPVYFDRGQGPERFARLRYLGEIQQQVNGFGAPPRPVRYTQPAHSGVHVYFWPGAPWQNVVADATVPIIVTEGEAKAARACREGFVTVGLGGVYNFSDRAGRLLPELEQIRWDQRDTYIVFDSDAATNPDILAAEARIIDELQRVRGARCHIVRLPPQNDGSKMGLDDFLRIHGANELAVLMKGSPAMTALDLKVLALNQSVAWIEAEGQIYDLQSKIFIGKDNFTVGSKYSAYTHASVGGTQRKTVKMVSIAKTWLTHPYAQRYSEILFRPNEDRIVRGMGGGHALNMWDGYQTDTGDVTPFLDLTTHIFSRMEAHNDLPLKLIIYKAQNPHIKIPLSIILTGPEGTGKTLWGDCLREAFGQYGKNVDPEFIHSNFRPWLEQTLLITVNEAEGSDMKKAASLLRGLISDPKHHMNDKFRSMREIIHYAFYIITANDTSVGSFRTGDRRNIVVGTPKGAGPDLYDRVHAWLADNGAKKLMGWMLNYDLQGWKPPKRAPDTAEKDMARREGMTLVQKLAERMQSTNQSVLLQWLDAAVMWARQNELSTILPIAQNARAILDTAALFQIRPWYTPEELLMLFPAISQQLMGMRFNSYTPAGQLSKELRDAGINYLVNLDDHRGFFWNGQWHQFLVISNFEDFSRPLRQADFDRAMANWPTYGQLRSYRR